MFVIRLAASYPTPLTQSTGDPDPVDTPLKSVSDAGRPNVS
jgi:hypothetical protein